MKKHIVRLLYDCPGWAYHARCRALQKYAPDDFDVSIGPDYGKAFRKQHHDLTLQLCYSCAKNIRNHIQKAGYKTLVVSGFNVAAGYHDGNWFGECLRHSDHVVINSEKCWNELGCLPNTTWISNGVDREVFKPVVPIGDRQPVVLSIGSKCHQANKGFSDVLPKVEEALKSRGIRCDFRVVNSHGGGSRMKTGQLAEWYQQGMIYVVASKAEGTPNPALEAASSGCVLVSTRVGNMPELIRHGQNGKFVDRGVQQIVAAVRQCVADYPRMAAEMQRDIEAWDWKHRATQYYDLFRRLIQERDAAACRSGSR